MNQPKDYRTDAIPPRHYTMRISPLSSLVFSLVWGLFAIWVASDLVLLGFRERSVLSVIFYSFWMLFGCWVGVMGYRSFRTRHRFTLSNDELLIEWVRGGKVARAERIPRAELIDVAVGHRSRSRVFGLALGTRNGEIDLSEGRTSWGLDFYRARCEQLASFLGIPVRP